MDIFIWLLLFWLNLKNNNLEFRNFFFLCYLSYLSFIFLSLIFFSHQIFIVYEYLYIYCLFLSDCLSCGLLIIVLVFLMQRQGVYTLLNIFFNKLFTFVYKKFNFFMYRIFFSYFWLNYDSLKFWFWEFFDFYKIFKYLY
jgi:hypothetical protein